MFGSLDRPVRQNGSRNPPRAGLGPRRVGLVSALRSVLALFSFFAFSFCLRALFLCIAFLLNGVQYGPFLGAVFWLPFGSLLAPFGFLLALLGALLAPLGALFAHFGSLLAHFWCPWAQFWCPWVHFCSPWRSNFPF